MFNTFNFPVTLLQVVISNISMYILPHIDRAICFNRTNDICFLCRDYLYGAPVARFISMTTGNSGKQPVCCISSKTSYRKSIRGMPGDNFISIFRGCISIFIIRTLYSLSFHGNRIICDVFRIYSRRPNRGNCICKAGGHCCITISTYIDIDFITNIGRFNRIGVRSRSCDYLAISSARFSTIPFICYSRCSRCIDSK